MTLRAIGFDLDNTLYDQAQHMRSFFRVAADDLGAKFQAPPSDIEHVFTTVWTRRTSYYARLFDEVLEELGRHDKLIVRELISLYHRHRADLTLFDGVGAMLGRLRSRVPLFLITDGNEEMQQAKIDTLGLGTLFDEIIITGHFGKDWAKPAVHAYRRIVERFGGAPFEYLYVGDNPACDFYGAKQLGMRTVRVLTEPFARHEPLDDDYAAHVAVTRTTDLEQVLHDFEAAI